MIVTLDLPDRLHLFVHHVVDQALVADPLVPLLRLLGLAVVYGVEVGAVGLVDFLLRLACLEEVVLFALFLPLHELLKSVLGNEFVRF